jgi:hypothetical protein
MCSGGAPPRAPATGAVALADALDTVDDPGGGKIRARDVLHEGLDLDLGIIDVGETGVHHLGEVVRRDVGRHPDRDPRGPVDQQVG